MGYTLEIDHAGGTYALDANYNFNLRALPVVNAKKVVEYIDVYIDANGQVTGATPAAVAAALKEQYEITTLRLTPVTVTISLDGTEIFSFTPAGSVSGPCIEDFHTDPEDGNGGSKWAFTLVMFARLPGNNFQGLHELQTKLTTVKNMNGDVVEKVWEASAKAKTHQLAKAGIMKFKPAGKVREVTALINDPEPGFGAVWTWERILLTYTETITVVGLGRSYEVDPQAGVDVAPLLHLARRGAATIILNGVARAAIGDRLVAPPPHWRESKTMVREEALETKSFPHSTDEDLDLGIQRLEYQEIWTCTAKTIPPPSHGAHNSTTTVKVPADGAIAR